MVLACLNPPRDYSAIGTGKFLPPRTTRAVVDISKERLTWLGGWLMFGVLAAIGVYALLFVGGTRAVLSSSAITLPDGLTSATAGAAQNLAAAMLAQLVWRAVIPAAGLLIVAVVLISVGVAGRKTIGFRV